MDDALLVRQVLAGNRNAFRFLVLRYQRPVFGMLRAFRLPESVVEELAQECFLKAFDNLSGFDPERGASFSTWLFTIARNLGINECSRHSYKRERGGDEPTREAARQADPARDQEAVLTAAHADARLRDAVHELPPPFRAAVELSYLRELSLEEIARLEHCSVGTVKSRVFRGKELLKALLFQEAKAW